MKIRRGGFLLISLPVISAACLAQTMTQPHLFGSTGGDGVHPYANMIQASDGNFYGTLAGNGGSGEGGIFSLTPGGAYKMVYSFTNQGDGANPFGSLVQARDGYLYGTTSAGGPASSGTLFRMLPGAASVTTLYAFANGGEPESGLVPDGSGNLYGTTASDGAYNSGSAYRWNISTGYTLLHSFATADGTAPTGAPLLGSDGVLYGTSSDGGSCGTAVGTLWAMNTDGSNFHVVHCFTGGTVNAVHPGGGLVQAADTRIYGFSKEGGTNGAGAVFSFLPGSSTVTLAHSFAAATEPAAPLMGTMAADSSGNLYYTGYTGGTYGDGGVGQMQVAGGIVNPLANFANSTGFDTHAQATLGVDGNLYGTTYFGDTYGYGAIWKLATGYAPQLTLSAGSGTVLQDQSFPLTYSVVNAFSQTMKSCFITDNAGNSFAVTGTSGTVSAVSTLSGTVTFGFTCGGVESTTLTMAVTPNPCAGQICMTAVSHNYGAVPEGTTSVFGMKLTNYTGQPYPFAIAMAGSSQFSQVNGCGTSEASYGGYCEVLFTYASPNDIESDQATFTLAGPQGFNPANNGVLTARSVTAGVISLNSNGHNFGPVPLGTSQGFGWLIQNGTTAAQPISFTLGAGNSTDYKIMSNTCSATLAPGGSCAVSFTYTPTGTAWTQFTDTLNSSVPVNPGSTLTLSGYGVAAN